MSRRPRFRPGVVYIDSAGRPQPLAEQEQLRGQYERYVRARRRARSGVSVPLAIAACAGLAVLIFLALRYLG